MKYLSIIFFSVFLFSSCEKPAKDDYLEEEEHLENKDHSELVDPDTVPDVH